MASAPIALPKVLLVRSSVSSMLSDTMDSSLSSACSSSQQPLVQFTSLSSLNNSFLKKRISLPSTWMYGFPPISLSLLSLIYWLFFLYMVEFPELHSEFSSSKLLLYKISPISRLLNAIYMLMDSKFIFLAQISLLSFRPIYLTPS